MTSSENKPLSLLLKEGTAQIHHEAENVPFVSRFLRGQINPEEYKKMIVVLYGIYESLEQALDEHRDGPLALIYFPDQLSRTACLSLDAKTLFGRDWLKYVREHTSNATQRYKDRISLIAAENPNLLAAHSYTRYLGDLSGGRALGTAAKKALSKHHFDSSECMHFFSFKAIVSPLEFKNMYRERLDAMPLSIEEKRDIVGEAVQAFKLNMYIFKEFDNHNDREFMCSSSLLMMFSIGILLTASLFLFELIH